MTLEPKPTSTVVPPANLPADWESSPLDPHEFLAYVEATITPEMLIGDRPAQAKLDYILGRHFYRGSRTTETTNIHTGERATRDLEADFGLINNPAPVIELRHESSDGRWHGSSYIHEAFRLKEESGGEHYYFFRTGNPVDDVPSYLRPSDVVPSGTYRQTFPPEARERMLEELGIDDEGLSWLRHNCDPILAQYQVLVDIPFNKPLERVPAAGGHAERYNYVEGKWEQSGGNYDPGLRVRVAKRLKATLRPKLERPSQGELLPGA